MAVGGGLGEDERARRWERDMDGERTQKDGLGRELYVAKLSQKSSRTFPFDVKGTSII